MRPHALSPPRRKRGPAPLHQHQDGRTSAPPRPPILPLHLRRSRSRPDCVPHPPEARRLSHLASHQRHLGPLAHFDVWALSQLRLHKPFRAVEELSTLASGRSSASASLRNLTRASKSWPATTSANASSMNGSPSFSPVLKIDDCDADICAYDRDDNNDVERTGRDDTQQFAVGAELMLTYKATTSVQRLRSSTAPVASSLTSPCLTTPATRASPWSTFPPAVARPSLRTTQ